MALRKSGKVFGVSMCFIWLTSLFVLGGASDKKLEVFFIDRQVWLGAAGLLSLLVFFQSILIYRANSSYEIDLDSGRVTFPRSDIENSILDIIVLKPYWNLVRRMTVNSVEIENLFLDTRRWSTSTGGGKKKHVLYCLNIVGAFGSASFEFGGRQKRDEVRNAISQVVKKKTNRNIDKKVAEF
jgi:hypothetical protein